MKPLVVQFFVPAKEYKDPTYNQIGVNDELFEYSVKSVKEYCEKFKIDYKLITKPTINHIHPTFERFDLFFNSKWWEDYTHILYLDTDIIVWKKSPNVFEEYPSDDSFKPVQDRIAMKNSIRYHEDRKKGTCLEKFDAGTLQKSRFNAGVFMLTKKAVDKISPHLDYKNLKGDDNEMLIYAMLESKVKVEQLDWKYNKKNSVSCYFGHASGYEKFKPNYNMLAVAKETFDTSI